MNKSEKVLNISDYRAHDAAYVACMECAQDWTAVFPSGVKKLQCPKCGSMAGEPVQIHNRDWFQRFVRGGANQQQQMLVCLNANRMENP